MAKTDWTIHDVVKPEDLNQLSQDVNEAGSKLDAHIGSRGNTHLTATRTEAGFMSAADKQELDKLAEEMGNMGNVPTQAKTVSGAISELHATGKSNESLLQGATSASTANTLVKRDASGRFKAAAPVAADDVARKAEIDAANNSISNHASNTSNPHSVTKAQVGLGNVPNYPAATQAQAEAGVDNGSFMTPLTTRQAIDSRTRYGTTGGTGTAYTLTLSPVLQSLYTGVELKIKLHTTNTGAATLNVSGLGSKSLRNAEGAAFAAGDLVAGRIYTFVYDGANFILCNGGGDEVRIDFDNYLFYPEKTLNRATSGLPSARTGMAAATVGNYALFAGGMNSNSDVLNTVSACNDDLVHTIATALSQAKNEMAAATVGNYALFAGYGETNVDAYNTNLTRTTPTSLSSYRYYLAAASVGNYAFFAGGSGSGGVASDVVDAYNTNLTRTTPTALSIGRFYMCGASVGDYALFAGGATTSYSGNRSNVDAYNTNLTRTTPTVIYTERARMESATVGNYALFAGGSKLDMYGGVVSNLVDAYNTNLTRSNVYLSIARVSLAGASINDYALFAGGLDGNSNQSKLLNLIDAYNISLTRTNPTPLSQVRSNLVATSVNGVAIFAGGRTVGTTGVSNDSYVTNLIESINYDYKIAEQHVVPGSKYNFGDGEQIASTPKIRIKSPATGYIKMKKGVLTQ